MIRTMFAITVSHTSLSKEHVFLSLEDLCLKLLVVKERHNNSSSFHHHLYLRTLEQHDENDVKDLIKNIYDISSNDIYVKFVKKESTYIKYITKEDLHPLIKGIEHKNLSFAFRSIQWAKSVNKFDMKDPFVLNHPQYYKLLQGVFESVQADHKNNLNSEIKRIEYPTSEVNDIDPGWHHTRSWQLDVINWWNDWIINGWHPKKKQLYLYGPSNSGKSTLIDNILKESMGPNYHVNLFEPTPNDRSFAYQNFDSLTHKVAKCDEFDIKEYCVSDIKKALEGAQFTVNRKGISAHQIAIKIPFILISNLEPPSDTIKPQYRGIKERLHCVYAPNFI
jgi:hypothetical protein